MIVTNIRNISVQSPKSQKAPNNYSHQYNDRQDCLYLLNSIVLFTSILTSDTSKLHKCWQKPWISEISMTWLLKYKWNGTFHPAYHVISMHFSWSVVELMLPAGSHIKIIQLSKLQQTLFNSYPPSVAYMRQWTWSSLIHIIDCHLFGAAPLPKPMPVHCHSDSREQVSVKFKSELYHLLSIKCIWQCRLPKWRPFCTEGNELTKPFPLVNHCSMWYNLCWHIHI